ncbi:MAG: hypothetical protein AB7O65_01730 [Candidatus Korobacteraceae bacterium]
MKNLSDVIRQKEQAIAHLNRDLEVLRAAARLLGDEEGEQSAGTSSARPSVAALRQDPAHSVASAISYDAGSDSGLRQFP